MPPHACPDRGRKRSSKRFTRGPLVSQPDRRVATTSSISSSPKLGRKNGILVGVATSVAFGVANSEFIWTEGKLGMADRAERQACGGACRAFALQHLLVSGADPFEHRSAPL